MVSGLRPHTRGLSQGESIALFRLAFATAPCHPLNLAYDRNSPVHSAKGTPSPMNIPKEVQSGLRLLVSVRFQDLFHSPPGELFTFPPRTCFTFGHKVILTLGRWSSKIPTEFFLFGRTKITLRRK